jgi:site-specific recombinase XerD
MKEAQQVYLGPAVNIFVRHSASCPYKGDGSFKRCACWKHLRWFDKGSLHFSPTKSRTWAGAERAKREKEIALDPGHVPLVTTEPSASIGDAIKTYLLAKKGENVGKQTIRKLTHQLGRFKTFMEKRGKFLAHQITREDLIEFRATWTTWESGTTRQKAQQNLRGFLKAYCSDANQLKWLLDSLKAIKLSREDEDRLEPQPYAEEEITKLIQQVPITFAHTPYKIAPMTALIHCQVATGLAIVDAVLLEKANIADGWLRIKRKKTNRRVKQRLDPALQQELFTLANSNPRYVFWNGTSIAESATGAWQKDLQSLMEDAGLYIKGNLSHRFRDTAVDFWLGQGWTLTDVADALGDTVAIVEKHYKTMASKRAEERFGKLPVRSWK